MPSVIDRIGVFGRGLLAAFRESFLTAADPGNTRSPTVLAADDWGSYPARMVRYAILWAYYENTAYAEAVHRWSGRYKHDYALYQDVRSVFSVGHRLGEFWGTHLWGGNLDPAAGDGKAVPSALPILTGDPGVRPAIARLWADSCWQAEKDTAPLLGAVMGDVAIKVHEHPDEGRVHLKVVDPRHVAAFLADSHGDCSYYSLQYRREDPRPGALPGTWAWYREDAERKDGGGVRFRTYIDDLEPFDWDGQGSDWSEDYPAVPLWVVRHHNVGLPWGFAESFPILSKMREIDNDGSLLSDFVAKAVDVVWLFKGVQAPADGLSIARTTASTADPRAGRYQVGALYGGPEADAKALVAGLDIKAVREFVKDLQDDIEREYPELRDENKLAAGDASGKAIRYARARTETKAHQRRAGYDHQLARAMQFAVSLGGDRGYDGYAGYSHASPPEFSVGTRSVFGKDPLDDLELQEKFWQVAESAIRSGFTIEDYLTDAGWEASRIARFKANRDAEDARLMERATAQAAIQQPNRQTPMPRQAPTNGEAARQAAQNPGGM